MAYIGVTNKVINNFNNENLALMLNCIIDKELSKDESQVNTKLVNDCVDALIALETEKNNGFSALVPLASSEDFLRTLTKNNSKAFSAWRNLNKFARASIVAAAIVGTTISANAAVEAVTNVNVIKVIGEKLQESIASFSLSNGIEVGNGEDDEEPVTELTTKETTTEETTTEVITSTTVHQIEVGNGEDDDETTKPSTTEGIEIGNGDDDDGDETTTKATTQGIEVGNGDDDDGDETTTETTTQGIEVGNGDDDDGDEATTEATTQGIEVGNGDDDDGDETTTETTTQGIEVGNGDDDDGDETTTTTKPTQEYTTVRPVTPVIPTNPTNPNEPTTQAPVRYIGLSASYDDDFKFDYIYGEELSYNGLHLTAHYSDGTTESISIEDTSYTKGVNMNVTEDYVLSIRYKFTTININITVRPDEYTRGSKICSNDSFDYLLTSNGAYVTKYKGNDTNINIDEIDGFDVIAIGPSVFEGMNVEYVNAQNVERIFDNAFNNCEALVDCYTPRAKHIGSYAFENCEAMQEAVFSDNLEYLGRGAYANTGITEIVIPEAINVIPDDLCNGCKRLADVDLNGATHIGERAFKDCTALLTVNGTQNITDAGEQAFFYCEEMTMDSDLATLENAGQYAFDSCKKLVFGSLENLKSFDEGAFEYCFKLTEVIIPEDMTEIPYSAFQGTRLRSVVLPDGLVKINDYAFAFTMLGEITVPENVTYIGTYALYSPNMRKATFKCRNVIIDDSALFINSRLTIYGYENSTAIDFAIENEIDYEIIENN